MPIRRCEYASRNKFLSGRTCTGWDWVLSKPHMRENNIGNFLVDHWNMFQLDKTLDKLLD